MIEWNDLPIIRRAFHHRTTHGHNTTGLTWLTWAQLRADYVEDRRNRRKKR